MAWGSMRRGAQCSRIGCIGLRPALTRSVINRNFQVKTPFCDGTKYLQFGCVKAKIENDHRKMKTIKIIRVESVY